MLASHKSFQIIVPLVYLRDYKLKASQISLISPVPAITLSILAQINLMVQSMALDLLIEIIQQKQMKQNFSQDQASTPVLNIFHLEAKSQ
jgi:hypothetical protein